MIRHLGAVVDQKYLGQIGLIIKCITLHIQRFYAVYYSLKIQKKLSTLLFVYFTLSLKTLKCSLYWLRKE